MEFAAKILGAGVVAGPALGGVAVGIGAVFGGFVQGYARNPSLKGQLFTYTILGFALAEAMGLLGLMMAFYFLFGL